MKTDLEKIKELKKNYNILRPSIETCEDRDCLIYLNRDINIIRKEAKSIREKAEKGCGKDFVEPFDFICGVAEVNGIPKCPSCQEIIKIAKEIEG